MTRAKQHRITQGFLLGCGNNIYGYDYHRRTPTSIPSFTINKDESKIVKQVFETYAGNTVGMNQITRKLEEQKAPTKYGKNIWRVSLLRSMLQNEMYMGIRYYNTMRRTRTYANPIHNIQYSSAKITKRDRSEWIGVKVPSIISKSLFAKVKKRIEWNRKHYRNPRVIQLFSSMIKCGEYGRSMFCYRRYYTDKRAKNPKIYHRVSYKCSRRHQKYMHTKKSVLTKCTNPEIKSEVLESEIFEMIQETLLNPDNLREHMDFFKRRAEATQTRIERQLKEIEIKTEKLSQTKKLIIDLYASGELERDAYITKNLEYDNELNKLKGEKEDLLKKIPLLHKKEIIDMSIKQYCDNAKTRFDRVIDFDTKRQFILDYVEKIVYQNNKVEIHGSVPIKLKAYEESNSELAKIEFCIKGVISRIKKI
jgi:hypothetical protein